MFTDQQITEQLASIQERNRRVELDKAWEISWTRRLFIMVATYIVAGVWLMVIRDSYPWLKAFVPTGGYLLSTLSLPVVKRWWGSYYIDGRRR